jgi:hypothetical protein
VVRRILKSNNGRRRILHWCKEAEVCAVKTTAKPAGADGHNGCVKTKAEPNREDIYE